MLYAFATESGDYIACSLINMCKILIFAYYNIVCYLFAFNMPAPDIHNSTAEERRDYVREEWKCLANCDFISAVDF